MSRIEMPDTKAEELELRCWCGWRGVYAQLESHRATHRGEKAAKR